MFFIFLSDFAFFFWTRADSGMSKIFDLSLAFYIQLCYIIWAINACPYPGVAQLVACLNGVQEAGSSNLLTRTKKKSSNTLYYNVFEDFFTMRWEKDIAHPPFCNFINHIICSVRLTCKQVIMFLYRQLLTSIWIWLGTPLPQLSLPLWSYLPIYRMSSVFEGKHYVIIAVPQRMCQTVCFFFFL